MFRLYTLMIILSIAAASAAAKWVGITGPQEAPVVAKVLADNANETILEFTASGYNLGTVEIDGKTYSIITLPKAEPLRVKGYPELPKVCKSIMIPDEAKMSYEIVQAEYDTLSVAPVMPSKGDLLMSQDPNMIPYTFGKIYEEDKWWPEKIIQLSDPYILRDVRGLTVGMNIFRTNAIRKQLIVCRRLVVRVFTDGIGTINVKKRHNTSINPAFESIYNRQFINYSKSKVREMSNAMSLAKSVPDTMSNGSPRVKMLIIAADSFYNNMIPLRDWRTRKGLRTELVKCSSIGTTAEAIQARLQLEYNRDSLAYVLLVGDGNTTDIPTKSIPSFFLTPYLQYPDFQYPSDPTYALLDGNDYYPEIYISRFSASTAAEIDNMVNRTIRYETNPPTDNNWFQKAAFIANNVGIIHEPIEQTFAQFLDLNRFEFVNNGFSVDTLYGLTNITVEHIANSINDGKSFVLYSGHGAPQGWNGPAFTCSQINGLINYTNKFPFIISSACSTGMFHRGDKCFAETWLTAGTAECPKGAIAALSASNAVGGWWTAELQAATIDLICVGAEMTIGEIVFNGECKTLEILDGICIQEVDRLHLFGDAAVYLWTKYPSKFTSASVTYDDISVTVDAGVDSAMICVSSNDNGLTFWERRDNVSNYTFNTSVRPLYVTISKHNFIPDTVYVTKDDTISGYVRRTVDGEPISGVVMNGLPGSPITDENGYYSAVVTEGWGWSGSVKPTKEGYFFSPDSTIYNKIKTNQTTNYTLKKFSITSNARGSGTIAPWGDTVICGESATFRILPESGYHIGDVTVDGISIGTDTSYTFENVTSVHTIFATFYTDSNLVDATEIPMAPGWNYASVSRVVSNDSAVVFFPGSTNVSIYDPVTNAYIPVETVCMGQGYLVHYDKPTTVIVSGPAAPIENVSYVVPDAGKIFIGSREIPLNISMLRLTDNAVINGDATGFDPLTNSYYTTTVISPGAAYWLNVSKACTIFIDNNHFSGEISSDTTWDGIVIVDDIVSVINNATLTIKKKSQILFKEDCSIEVTSGSRLLANEPNEAADSIRFVKFDPEKSWNGLLLYGDNNEFKWCIFDGGYRNINLRSRGNSLSNCAIRNAVTAGIYTYYTIDLRESQFVLDSCEIKQCGGAGILIHHAEPTISNSNIINNRYGLYCSNSTVNNFIGNVIEGNTLNGIFVGPMCNFIMGDGNSYPVPDPLTNMTPGAGKNRLHDNVQVGWPGEDKYNYEIYVDNSGRLFAGERNGSNVINGFNRISWPLDRCPGKYIYNNAMTYVFETWIQWIIPARFNRWGEDGTVGDNNFFTNGSVDCGDSLLGEFDPTANSGAPPGSVPDLNFGAPGMCQNPVTVLTSSIAEKLSERSSSEQAVVDLKNKMLTLRNRISDPRNAKYKGRLFGELNVLAMRDPYDRTGEKSTVMSLLSEYRERLVSNQLMDADVQLSCEAALINEIEYAFWNKDISTMQALIEKYGQYVKNSDHRRVLLFEELALYERLGDYEKAWEALQTAKAIGPDEHRKKNHVAASYDVLEAILREKAEEAGIVLAVEGNGIPGQQLPKQIALLQNYPNPFNPMTTIKYELPASARVSLKVYDMLGREVALLQDGIKEAGYWNATFDASKLSSGVYFSRLVVQSGNGDMATQVKKMLLVK